MRARTAVLGLIGSVATALAAILAVAPGVVGSVGPIAGLADALGEANARHVLLLGSALVGVVLSVAGWRASSAGGGDADAFDAAVTGSPEGVTAARQRLTGAELGVAFEAATNGDEAAVDRVRDRLRTAATRASVRATGCDEDAAREAVLDGTWTDDATAAAVLSDGDGPTHSVGSRLRLWLDPERERERRYARTVDAIAGLGGRRP